MVAAVRYLFDSEPDTEKNPAPFAGSPATLTQRTTERTVEMSDSSSNQTETGAGSATNPPAQT
jgi:hypothetical protein